MITEIAPVADLSIAEMLTSPAVWASFLTLTLLEIILGIDNVIFLSIVSGYLPKDQQAKARRIGLIMALVMRIGLLASIAWIMSLTKPIFAVWDHEVSWRDIILLIGGLFLLFKGTDEIHHEIEGDDHEDGGKKKVHTFFGVIAQIAVLDMVFSLDSVITAVGMSDHLPVMIAAVCVAIGVMMVAAEPTAAFIEKHPTIKMLALSFLLLVGVALIADALHFHIPRGYLYFAIAFSIGVEVLNMLVRNRRRIRKPKPIE
ncbi:MAG TPA: TerC family protein [Micavibrio sp.]|nr:TerC family protein [Micavibrio sp.]HIL29257.1 TerC family protein [Micavibrio sp.]